MFKRNCPKCNKELIYKNKYVCFLAQKNNRCCYSCRIVNRKGKTTNCSQCGNSLYRRPHQLKKRERHFCNNKCQALFASEHLSGKNNKLWKGGEEVNRKKYRALVNERRLKNKQKAISLLGGKCNKCGFSGCIDVFQFHHLNPKEKDQDMCKLFGKEWGNKIDAELKKCELLCANCHVIHHWNNRHDN